MRISRWDASRIAAILIGALFLPAAPAFGQDSGEKTYKARCASCHGPDGAGATPAGKATKARDLCSDELKKETDEQWTEIINKGKNKMPSYEKKLTADEVKSVIGCMRSLCKK